MKLIGPLLVAGAISIFNTGSAFGMEPHHEGKMVTLVAFGDSTTAPRGSVQIYLDCLKSDLPKKGMKVDLINAGIGGNTTEDARGRFAKDVLDRHPDVVVIQFGINDSAIDVWQTPPATHPRVTIDRYTSNLEYFVVTLQKQECKVILMTPNPIRWTPSLKKKYGKPPYRPNAPDGFNVILQTYAEGVREVAQKNKVLLVDVYAAFQAYGKGKSHSFDELLLDGMHPNDKGHRLVANLLLKEILSEASEAPKGVSPSNNE